MPYQSNPIKVSVTLSQIKNDNWQIYNTAEELMAGEQILVGLSHEDILTKLEELDPNALNNRKAEVLEVLNNQTLTFDKENQQVIKTRIWPDLDLYDLYKNAPWDVLAEDNPDYNGRNNYLYISETIEEVI